MEISINNTFTASGLSKVCDFTIETNGIMVKALTSRLYSNPIASIVRELASNALDACPTSPMDITVPSALDPQFTIRDHGPGISPEDMASIFTHFGSSTKRNTNSQIGGFGLGAKSPFALVNSFTIYSYYQGTCYHYVAAIQTDGMPALHLVASYPCATSGVQIQIPASSHFHKWYEALDQIRFFTPRPNIHGHSFTYPITIYDCPEFSIYQGNSSTILVGPVAYPFRNSRLVCGEDDVLPLALKFNIGELEVTASREEIVYSDDVIFKLRARYKSAKVHYQKILQDLLDKTPTMADAFLLLGKNSHPFPVKYRGGEITFYSWEPPAQVDIRARILDRRHQKRKIWNLQRPWGRTSHVYSGCPIFLADTSDRIASRIQLHPAYTGETDIQILDCDPALLDSFGISYHRLSAVQLTKQARNTQPVRLRSLDDRGKFVVSSSNHTHYLQLDTNKCATINGVTARFTYSLYLSFKEMLGYGFYVLPHNIRKIPAHLLPVEPEICTTVPSETARLRQHIARVMCAHTMSVEYIQCGRVFSAMGLISPMPWDGTPQVSIRHLQEFKLLDIPGAYAPFPNWKKEIKDVLTRCPQYRVLGKLSLDESTILDLAAIITKE